MENGNGIIKFDDTNNNNFINSDFINNDRGVNINDYPRGTTNSCLRLDEDDNENRNDNLIASIYRYKFTQEFMDELYKFSKVHQYDDRKVFKEAWNNWTEDEEELIEKEINRLEELGYDGDVLDKMFKSARYYFRKKSSIKPEPKERRKYIGVQKEFLDNIDLHISNEIMSEDYKPSDGFNNFCINNTDALRIEIARLIDNGIGEDDIQKKIKKTYKNRYFMLINK